MKVFEIGCQVGDFIRYYSNISGAIINKHNLPPVDLIVDINIDNDPTRHIIIITDGIVNKFNRVSISNSSEDPNKLIIEKRLKVCKANKYAIGISYTQVVDEITECSIDIYMEDTKKTDEIYNEIPNDIDFR